MRGRMPPASAAEAQAAQRGGKRDTQLSRPSDRPSRHTVGGTEAGMAN